MSWSISEGIEVSEDQEKVFKELDDLFWKEEGWEDLESPYAGVEMWIKTRQQEKGERRIPLGRAESVADCTAEGACAWLFDFCSEERVASHREEGNHARLEIRAQEPRLNEKEFATVKRMPFPLSMREFVGKFILRKNEDGSFSAYSVPTDSVIDYGGIGRLVRGITKVIFTATNIESAGGVKQCKVQLLQYLDAGGFIPAWLVNQKIHFAFGVVKFLAVSFQCDEEIDRAALTSFSNTIKNEPQIYTEEEEEAIERGKVRLDKERATVYYCTKKLINFCSSLCSQGIFRNVYQQRELQGGQNGRQP